MESPPLSCHLHIPYGVSFFVVSVTHMEGPPLLCHLAIWKVLLCHVIYIECPALSCHLAIWSVPLCHVIYVETWKVLFCCVI